MSLGVFRGKNVGFTMALPNMAVENPPDRNFDHVPNRVQKPMGV